jgi:hypothetical protein
MADKQEKLAREIRGGADGDYDLANYDAGQVRERERERERDRERGGV